MVYERQTANALAKIKQKGREVILRTFSPADDPDSKPWHVDHDETETQDYTVNILFLPPTGPNAALVQALGGTDITTGQDYGLMGNHGITPSVNDRIYDEDGETLLRTISNVDPLAPNGENILYTIGFEA